MKHASLGILLQKHVSLRFLPFPANKRIIETLPELQLCFLLERVTDPAKQRESEMQKNICCVIPFILLTYTAIPQTRLQVLRGKSQEMPEKQRGAEMSLFFCSLWKCQTHQSTIEHTSLAAERQGGMQIQWPLSTWFLCWKPLHLPASCSSGFVCARNTCLGWTVWLCPQWGLPGFPAASLRVWGLLLLIPWWWDLHFPLCLHP